MAAPKGNQFWKLRSSHGPKPEFTEPSDLWDACEEYFIWVEDNPLKSAELVKFQGVATMAELPKRRAMTINGLCIFLGIHVDTWHDWRSRREDLSEVISRAEAVIWQWKFEGAAADLLNPNIIARELGLADKKEHAGPDGRPIAYSHVERVIVDPAKD